MFKASKKIFLFLTYFFFNAALVFSQTFAVPKGIMTVTQTIESFLTSELVRGILTIMLICAAIGFAVSKNSERLRIASIAVGVAAIITGSASFIVSNLMSN